MTTPEQVRHILQNIESDLAEDDLKVATNATNWLKENGYINKERAKIKGEWQLTDNTNKYKNKNQYGQT